MFTTKWIVYFQPFSDYAWVISSRTRKTIADDDFIQSNVRPKTPLLRDFSWGDWESSDFCCSLLALSVYSADGIIWFAGLSESVRPSSRSRSCEHAEYMIMIDEQIFLKVKALERNQNELSSRPLLMPVMFDAFITKRNPRGGSLLFSVLAIC